MSVRPKTLSNVPMNGTTRCPHCETRFRITDAQLTAHQGMVRCGHCMQSFDARPVFIPDQSAPQLDQLIDETGVEESLVAAEVVEEAQSVAGAAPVEEVESAGEIAPAKEASLTEAIPSENDIWTQTVLYFIHEPMVAFKCGRYPVDKIINQFPVEQRRKIKESIDAVVELGFFVIDKSDICLTDKGEMLFQAFVEACQMSVDEKLELTITSPKFAVILTAIQQDNRLTPPSDLLAHTANNLRSQSNTHDGEIIPAGEAVAIEEAIPVENTGIAEEVAAQTLAEKVAFVQNEEDSIQPKRSIWPWAAGAFFLVLLLVAQSVYFFRVSLAAHLPALKPALEGYCHLLRCSVPLPQQSELMSIESSGLEATPDHENEITFSALLRNRASYTLAFPALALTLNDDQDKTLARRLFMPADYLPADETLQTGFAANHEVSIKLRLQTADLRPVGYRLELFYRQP